MGGASLSRALALSAELVTIFLKKGDWDELVLWQLLLNLFYNQPCGDSAHDPNLAAC